MGKTADTKLDGACPAGRVAPSPWKFGAGRAVVGQEIHHVNLVAKRFGERLKRWRKLHKLPLKHLATGLGVSIQVISDWERGVRFPCEKHLAQLEHYTGVPLCGFLHRADKECRCFEGCEGCACE